MIQPLVSIITVNYNEPEVTYEFLESVNTLGYLNLEVILVDNGSPSRPLDATRVAEIRPGSILIPSKDNLGFGGGNNLGIKASSGEFLFFVNNDTVLGKGLIEKLLEPFIDPRVGVVCPKILYFDQPSLIQYAGFTAIHPVTGRNDCIGFQEKDRGQHDQVRSTSGAHGAAMMVARKVIQKTGAFYEPFFLYYEETDWSSRILRDNFLIIYQPAAHILHKESVSVGKNSLLKTFYMTRNRLLFMKRNTGALKFAGFLCFYFLVSVPKNILTYLKNREPEHLRAFLQGTRAGIKIKSNDISASK